MTQGKFSKQEPDATEESVNEMFQGLTRSMQRSFKDHLNDILLFLKAAKDAAPSEN